MRHVKLWEDTVVISIRDMQWINEISRQKKQNEIDHDVRGENLLRPVVPPGLVKLDGRAESKLGDIALKAGERYFLVEVKSTYEEIRTEWRSRGKYRPKWPLKRLAELVEHYSLNPGVLEARAMMERSMRGHFVAYWNASEENGLLKGWVEARPYILACATARNLTEKARRVGMPMPFGIQSNIFYRGEKYLIDRCPLKVLLEAQVGMKLRQHDQPSGFGLDRDDFLEYVSFLCGIGEKEKGFDLPSDEDSDAEKQEKIHAVVLTTHGSFFEVVVTTNRIATLLDGKARPTIKLRRNSRVAYSHGMIGAAPMG